MANGLIKTALQTAAPALGLGGATAVLSGLASLWGTKKAADANRENQKLIDRNLKTAEQERLAKPKNYLDTESGKAIATEAREQLQTANNAVNNNAVKTGMTEAQKLANNQANQKAYSETLGKLAQMSDAYNQENDKTLQEARNQYTNAQANLNSQRAQSYSAAGNGVASALGNLGSGLMQTYGNALAAQTKNGNATTQDDALKKYSDAINNINSIGRQPR